MPSVQRSGFHISDILELNSHHVQTPKGYSHLQQGPPGSTPPPSSDQQSTRGGDPGAGEYPSQQDSDEQSHLAQYNSAGSGYIPLQTVPAPPPAYGDLPPYYTHSHHLFTGASGSSSRTWYYDNGSADYGKTKLYFSHRQWLIIFPFQYLQ